MSKFIINLTSFLSLSGKIKILFHSYWFIKSLGVINVSERLNDYGISYLINSDDEELFVKGDSLFYNNYLSMAQVSYEKETKISEINMLLKKVIDNNYEKYDEIKDMLSSYLKDN